MENDRNNNRRGGFAENIPHTTVKATGTVIRWGLAIIGIYIAVSTLILIITTKETFIFQIMIWSQGGFWAFFMGYWGWMFAHQITESFSKRIKKKT